MTDTERERRETICKVAGVAEIDDVSDGFHTFRQLYYQRMMLFAAIVRQNKDKAWKSFRHEDGELCFGGGWFIVGIDTPEGSYTYHYEAIYFGMFDCEELERGKHWDGHTEKDVTRLLSLPSAQPDTTTHDSIPAETGKNDGDGTSGDCISRTQAIDEIHEDAEWLASQGSDRQVERMERDKSILMSLPSAQPETNCSEIPNNWISCSERLPKESRKYLVTVFDGIGKRTTSAPYHRRSKSWTLTGRMAYWKVIAWMPLPEPARLEND